MKTKDPGALFELRKRIVALRSAGLSRAETAKALGVSEGHVSRIWSAFRSEGGSGIEPSGRTGPKRGSERPPESWRASDAESAEALSDPQAYDDLIPDIEYFVYRKTTPSWVMSKNKIKGIDLAFVTGGRARYAVEGKSFTVGRGDLICIPYGCVREAETCVDDLMCCYDVNFRLVGLDGRERALPFPLVSRLELYPDIIRLYQDLNEVWHHRSVGSHMRARAIFLMILERFLQIIVYQNAPPMDPRIRKIMRHIMDHYAETIHMDALSDMARLNKIYLGVLFKQNVGMSIHQFLTNTRLNHAEDLLQSGRCSVKEAAETCGFSDISYFSRVYKREKGRPPSRHMG